MPIEGCPQTIELLNMVFNSGVITNDGHEILERLNNGDDVLSIVDDLAEKFGQSEAIRPANAVIANWPALHLEAVTGVLQWALSKLDTDDRVMVEWKGDAEHPETVTRFELRDHKLLIEFAHPPVGAIAPETAQV